MKLKHTRVGDDSISTITYLPIIATDEVKQRLDKLFLATGLFSEFMLRREYNKGNEHIIVKDNLAVDGDHLDSIDDFNKETSFEFKNIMTHFNLETVNRLLNRVNYYLKSYLADESKATLENYFEHMKDYTYAKSIRFCYRLSTIDMPNIFHTRHIMNSNNKSVQNYLNSLYNEIGRSKMYNLSMYSTTITEPVKDKQIYHFQVPGVGLLPIISSKIPSIHLTSKPGIHDYLICKYENDYYIVIEESVYTNRSIRYIARPERRWTDQSAFLVPIIKRDDRVTFEIHYLQNQKLVTHRIPIPTMIIKLYRDLHYINDGFTILESRYNMKYIFSHMIHRRDNVAYEVYWTYLKINRMMLDFINHFIGNVDGTTFAHIKITTPIYHKRYKDDEVFYSMVFNDIILQFHEVLNDFKMNQTVNHLLEPKYREHEKIVIDYLHKNHRRRYGWHTDNEQKKGFTRPPLG